MEIRVESLHCVYSPGTLWQNKALNDVSFTIPSCSVLGILGHTGSGKTTLLKNLNGLLKPTSGQIFLDGIDTGSFQAQLSRMVGLVFQCPERQLFEDTVLKDISFPFRIDQELSEEEIFIKARDACEDVGLDLNKIGADSPESLSEASRRKLAIACILVNDPGIIMFDEPLAGMNPYSSLELVRMIMKMKSEKKRTIIIVSHDMAPFISFLDFMMALDNGRVRAFGKCGEVCEMLSEDSGFSELLPPVASLKHLLVKAGIRIPTDEFDPCVISKIVSLSLSTGDVSK